MLTVREIRLSSVSVALCLDDRRSTAVLLYIEAFSRETDKALFRSCCERVLCSRRLRQEQIKRGRTVTKKKFLTASQLPRIETDRMVFWQTYSVHTVTWHYFCGPVSPSIQPIMPCLPVRDLSSATRCGKERMLQPRGPESGEAHARPNQYVNHSALELVFRSTTNIRHQIQQPIPAYRRRASAKRSDERPDSQRAWSIVQGLPMRPRGPIVNWPEGVAVIPLAYDKFHWLFAEHRLPEGTAQGTSTRAE